MTARSGLIAAWLVLSLAALVWASSREFARQGDGWEYLLTTEALVRHGSPDIRDDDIDAITDDVEAWLQQAVGPTQPGAVRSVVDAELEHRFATAVDGRRYAMHFWLYSLEAVPARLLLAAADQPTYNALVVTNVLLMATVLGVVLFADNTSLSRQGALASMLLVTPVAWYLTFTGVEVSCWAFAVFALVALDRRRYGLSGLMAGIAAMQNPPIALLALVPVGVAASHRDWRAVGRAIAGAAVAGLPVAFYVWHFKTPSLVTRAHVDPGGISFHRTLSLLFDLDMGLLPYVPVLVALLPIAVWRIARGRDVRGGLLLVSLAGTVAMAETQTNWNSAGMGLHRYLVWMLPALTWLLVDVWTARARTAVAGALVVTSGLVLILDRPAETNWLEHHAPARWIMREAPAWYHPEFEVFAERSAHAEAPPGWMIEGRRDGWSELLPVAHGRASGAVTTLLVDADSAVRLRERFRVDDAYWPELQAIATAHATPVYVHPPPGSVWTLHDRVDGLYEASTVASERVRRPRP